MAAVLNYFKDSFEDFVLLAQHAPVQAFLSAILIATLVFTKVGADRIIGLQQSVLPSAKAIYDAEQQDDNGVNRSRNSSSVSQPSSYDSESYIPRAIPGRDRVSSGHGPSSASNASAIGQRRSRSSSRSSSFRVPSWAFSPPDSPSFFARGWGFNQQPEGRRSVSWYPSTSPSHRGKFVLPSSSLIFLKIHTSKHASD